MSVSMCVYAGEKNRLGEPPKKITKPSKSCGPFLQLFFLHLVFYHMFVIYLFLGKVEKKYVCVFSSRIKR